MCFCTDYKEAYTSGYMKKNVIILIGLVVLFAVLYVGNTFMGGSDTASKVEGENSSLAMKAVAGKVLRVNNGENILEYTFDVPETATTSFDMEGALIKVTDVLRTEGDASSSDPIVISTPVATFYISYEGARGYSPLDYISNMIAPHVSVIDPTGTSTIGSYDWQVAESEGSEWHIASVDGGKWLVIVENKKSTHDVVEKILESVSVK